MSDTTKNVSVHVLLDRSGSMALTKASTIEGYNEYVNGLKQDKDSEYRISLIQFDAPALTPELTVSYENQSLADVPLLSTETYVPRGNTPLYDAIGEGIRRVSVQDAGVIMLIITDGQENSSTEFTRDSIKALIKEKEAAGWTFSFLGANIDSYAVGGSLGVKADNISNYSVGNEKALFSNLAQATMTRGMQYRTAGVQASVKMSFLDDSQRAEMQNPHSTTGGRPAAPPSFPQSGKRREWAVRQS